MSIERVTRYIWLRNVRPLLGQRRLELEDKSHDNCSPLAHAMHMFGMLIYRVTAALGLVDELKQFG